MNTPTDPSSPSTDPSTMRPVYTPSVVGCYACRTARNERRGFTPVTRDPAPIVEVASIDAKPLPSPDARPFVVITLHLACGHALDFAVEHAEISASLRMVVRGRDAESVDFQSLQSPDDDGKPWFDDRFMIRDLPRDCVEECAFPGRNADPYVKEWVDRLGFEVKPAHAREYLTECGIEREKINMMSDEALNRYVLWMACADAREALYSSTREEGETAPVFYIGI